jgi:lipoate-protein ligase A
MVSARHPVKFLRLAAFPILQQLQLEEALLRATTHNWFVINEGTPDPTIVMGVSG